MELKTGKSIKSILQLLKSVTDAALIHKASGEIITLRSPISDEILSLLKLFEIIL